MKLFIKHSVIFILLLNILTETLKSSPETHYFNINPHPSIVGKTILFDSDRQTNPALLAQSDSNYASIIYSPSVFNISELSPAMIIIGNRINDDFVAAISFYNLGNSLYSDFSATLHSGLKISSMLDAGLSFSFDRISIKNYNNYSSFNINLGFILKLSEIFNAGFNYAYYQNPYPDEIKSLFNHLINAGLGLSLNNEISLEISSKILLNYMTGFSFSGRYNVVDYLALNLGFSTNPEIASFAIKINPITIISISAGFNYHSYLGLSKSFILSFYW